MIPRDSITGAEILAIHDGHHIVISDDGVGVIYLTPSAALLLARQLLEVLTPAEATGDR
jgi:hypothetical protein